MTEELQRNFSALKQNADPAPYFLSYEVTEQESQVINATLGTITSQNQDRRRLLDVSIRVGSPKLDNYRRLAGESVQFTAGSPLAIDDAPDAIKQLIWLETDRAYRAAAERLIRIRTNTEVKVAAQDDSDDFSSERPSKHETAAVRLSLRPEDWAGRLRKVSAAFSRYPEVLTSNVTLLAQADTRYFTSSEGSRLEHGRVLARIMVTAQGKAGDGMDLVTAQSFEAADPSGLPDNKQLIAAVEQVARDLAGLTTAPVVDPFVGPAIFSGRAAAVFFHEIFGHRIEGHRQKDESEGQTFTRALGTSVLPDFLSVVFDPTRRKFGNVDLSGSYDFDDEGIPAQKVVAVENGILKTFLMSRSPVKGFIHSNGHGRRQPGLEVVSRQSNLLLESSRHVTHAELRKQLVAEVQRQGKPYGLYFREVTGGFTNTSRGGVQAFKVIPLVVYRVYPDGRPDELVRGADIVGTPLASFSKILATSDRPEVFNGFCGAESGSVPVAAVSPAILVSEIEIEKQQQSQDRPPVLPPPPVAGGL
jgi:TldD protein